MSLCVICCEPTSDYCSAVTLAGKRLHFRRREVVNSQLKVNGNAVSLAKLKRLKVGLSTQIENKNNQLLRLELWSDKVYCITVAFTCQVP